jgi:GTP-binding protein EngB required for normal cell division
MEHRWTALRPHVLQVVNEAKAPLRAQEIASELNRRGLQVDRAAVNKFLYLSKQDVLTKGDDNRWSATLRTPDASPSAHVAPDVRSRFITDPRHWRSLPRAVRAQLEAERLAAQRERDRIAQAGTREADINASLPGGTVRESNRVQPSSPKIDATRPSRVRWWETDLEEFGKSFGCSPGHEAEETIPFEIGVIGLAAVGKSTLLNALVAPALPLVPAGGIGPLTGTPVRIRYASSATLRVTYLDRSWLVETLAKLEHCSSLSSEELGRLSLVCAGNQYAVRDPGWLAQAIRYVLDPDAVAAPDDTDETVRALRGVHEILADEGGERVWESDPPDGEFFRRIHDHVAGRHAGLCRSVEVGWPSPMLEAGLVLVDLPGLGAAHDAHSRHTEAWLRQARAVLLVTDRSGIAESVVTALRRNGFLTRVANGQADLIAVMTKLDQVTDDARRHEEPRKPWSMCFRSIVAAAETELLGQLGTVFAVEGEHGAGGADAIVRGAIRVFGASSREHQRLVSRDDDDPPRLLIPESTGIPGVRRALTALARLRSSSWTSELLDRVRAAPNFAKLLPELMAMVEMEGL